MIVHTLPQNLDYNYSTCSEIPSINDVYPEVISVSIIRERVLNALIETQENDPTCQKHIGPKLVMP